ncbi:MAG: SDR family oxidoreductase [Syntrophomonadaceae bacterium]|jgi:nucleoside-diphosphate-sugar epimerase
MILVTGITGLTGRFLYKELKKTRLEIKYLVRKSSNISFMDPGSDSIVFGDQRRAEEISSAMSNVDSVLHLAPRDQLQNILDKCIENNIQRLFYVNSTGIYSKFKSSSNVDIKNEEILKNSGLIYTIIRPTMIYGNHQDGNMHILIKIMNKTRFFLIVGRGEGLMHPIYAGDLAKFLVSILLNEEKTRFQDYNVAGKYPIKYKDMLKNISNALGKKVYFISIPYNIALLAGKIGDKIPNRLINYEKILRLNEDKNFDYTKAKEELAFNPISFEKGIQLEINEMRDNNLIK